MNAASSAARTLARRCSEVSAGGDGSKFGEVEIGIDWSNPIGLTRTWTSKHLARPAGAQYQLDSPWRLDFGVAYDSELQDARTSRRSPSELESRFGFGAQEQESKTFGWGLKPLRVRR